MKPSVVSAFLLFAVCAACAPMPVSREPAPETALLPLMRARDAEMPIQVQSMDISTSVSGSLAQTTVDMVFRNPNSRQLEGELQFPLQPSQQVSGFALDIDGNLRPAVPTPKARGRQAFEAIERRQVDPALLEKTVGNHFKLRVYPIPANGTRRVQVKLVEALQADAQGWRLELPLHMADTVDHFQWRVSAHGAQAAPQVSGAFEGLDFRKDGNGYTARVERRAFRPSTGLSLRIASAKKPRTYTEGMGGERYFLAEVPVEQVSVPRALPKVVGLLWDSSASAARRDTNGELMLLSRYFTALGNAEVRLIRLRDRAEKTQIFQVREGQWPELKQALQDTIYDGASALADWQPQADIDEYLLVSDGLLNYGKQTFPKLGKRQRLYALNSAGADADDEALTALAEANGGRLVRWQRPSEIDAAARTLLEDGARLVSIDGVGVDDLVAESREAGQGLLRIAGRMTDPEATLELVLREGGQSRTLSVPIRSDAPASDTAAHQWASYRIHELGAEADLNRAAIARLGQQFGIVTAETSLIVLDDIEDYVRYDIAPPAELREKYAQLRSSRSSERDTSRRERLDAVAENFEVRKEWWAKTWPKGPLPRPQRSPAKAVSADAAAVAYAPSPEPPTSRRAQQAPSLDTVMVAGNAAASESARELESVVVREEAGEGAKIVLQAWQPDSPYARRMRAAPADRVYDIYLDERASYANSSAFYLDVADVLIEKGQRDLALRVLSNLAEMDLENRHVLRVLGYRLLQAGASELALPVFEQVQQWAEEEPQSFRDLGLAYAANGRNQAAIDNLYEVVARSWDDRFEGIDQIVLAELNAIIATSRAGSLDTRRFDPRLLKNLPLDLRAVLSWDSDNSDMDLWVTDPNGEKCFYGHPLTYQGGAMSDDFTGGYGPEEFILRDAKPGKYKVEANFYGDRQQLVTGATTLQLQLTTGFGTARQQDRKVTLRLKDARETVLVGEFEVE